MQIRLDHQEETLRVAGEHVDGPAHSSLQVEIAGQQNDDPRGGLRDGVERISHLEASVTYRAGERESGLLRRRDHAIAAAADNGIDTIPEARAQRHLTSGHGHTFEPQRLEPVLLERDAVAPRRQEANLPVAGSTRGRCALNASVGPRDGDSDASHRRAADVGHAPESPAASTTLRISRCRQDLAGRVSTVYGGCQLPLAVRVDDGGSPFVAT